MNPLYIKCLELPSSSCNEFLYFPFCKEGQGMCHEICVEVQEQHVAMSSLLWSNGFNQSSSGLVAGHWAISLARYWIFSKFHSSENTVDLHITKFSINWFTLLGVPFNSPHTITLPNKFYLLYPLLPYSYPQWFLAQYTIPACFIVCLLLESAVSQNHISILNYVGIQWYR